MTTEEKLKQFILMHYSSIREFTQEIDMPYSTMATILKRGLDNASVTNVIKICQALGISVDDLAEGRIVPVAKEPSNIRKLEDIISTAKHDMLNADQLTLKGHTIPETRVHDLCMMLDLILDYEGMHYE